MKVVYATCFLKLIKTNYIMNKTIKMILLIVGVGLLGYGIYMLVAPETALSIGPLDVETQDNNNAYITIGLGLLTLMISFVGGKKS
jgi:hypothetical protein